jgi:hypothetical protein
MDGLSPYDLKIGKEKMAVPRIIRKIKIKLKIVQFEPRRMPNRDSYFSRKS